jgi:hypothetical protein
MATLNVADLNRQGKVYVAANAAAASVIAVTTSMTGLILYNPLSSGRKAVIVDVGFAFTTAPAAVVQIGIGMLAPQVVAPASLTAVTSTSADGAGNSPACFVYSAATLAAAPIVRRWSFGADFESAVGSPMVPSQDRVDGSIILVPGATACLVALTTTAVGVGSITWAEIPV